MPHLPPSRLSIVLGHYLDAQAPWESMSRTPLPSRKNFLVPETHIPVKSAHSKLLGCYCHLVGTSCLCIVQYSSKWMQGSKGLGILVVAKPLARGLPAGSKSESESLKELEFKLEDTWGTT